jgi:integrase
MSRGIEPRAGPPHPDPARASTTALQASTRFAVDASERSRLRRDKREADPSFLIVAARADEAAVTGLLGHKSIDTTRRIYAGDWREAEERNALVLRQLAHAGIGQ